MQPQPDFLFRTPTTTLGVRVGFASPRGSSEIYDFTSEQLTFQSSALDGASFGVQLGLRASERLEVQFDLYTTRGQTRTEFRDWVDLDDLPIQQSTYLSRVPLTVSLKAYLTERGRSVSRFAWIPARWAPYVGAGGGRMWFLFEQWGDWVDENPDDPDEGATIFTATYVEKGAAYTGHVLAGVDFSLGARFVLNAEGRYLWASAPMSGGDFDFFDNIDLSGVHVTAGISARF
jgi:hypothetical protein